MNPLFYSEEAGAKGLPPLSPAPPPPNLPPLRSGQFRLTIPNTYSTITMPASLRSDCLFTFAPERRSASFRNRCSPSPEYRRVKKLILAAKQSEETSRGCKPRLSNPFEFLDHRGMIKSPDSRCHASNTVRHLSNGRRKRYRKRRS